MFGRDLLVGLAALLVALSGAFAVPVGGDEIAPVNFDDTVSLGMTGAVVQQARAESTAIPRVQVYYSGYQYVIGYYGLESYLVERNRIAVAVEFEESAQGLEVLLLVVDQVGELLVFLVISRANRLLESSHGLRIPLVVDAVRAVFVLALAFEVRIVLEGDRVTRLYVRLDLFDADPLGADLRPLEVLPHEVRGETDGLEDLGALVALDGRDAHLRHRLQETVLEGFLEVSDSLGLVGPVRSEFGYHLIRVEARASQAVQVADLAYNLSPSRATLSDKESQLGDLAYFAEEEGAFEEEAQRLGLSVQEVQVETDQSSVPGIGQSAALSQFLESASNGTISDVIELSDKFVVAEVTNVTPEGYRSFSEVKSQIRPQVELQKKRAVQTRRMERALAQNTFEALPEALGTELRTQSDLTYSTSTVPGLGQEPQFVGTVFGLDEGETSGVVAGNNAAFIVKTTQKTTPPPLTDQKRKQLRQRLLKQRRQQVSSNWIAALKEDATIKDNRSQLR